MVQDTELEALRPLKASDVAFLELPRAGLLSQKAVCCLSVMQVGTMACEGSRIVKGYSGEMQMANFAFLLEHSQTKILFDLGLRKPEDYPQRLQGFIQQFNVACSHHVPDLLEDFPGCSIDDIDSIILSHLHPDHVGDLSYFGKSTKLILGPLSRPLDTQELADKLIVDPSVLTDRTVRYLDRETNKWQKIGCFEGLDFFEDGSMWILHLPGHMDGHIGALVRTEPDVYHLLAGDAAHHISLIDPDHPTSAGLFKSDQSQKIVTSMDDDLKTSYHTMAGLARMDMEPNVNVWLSHDTTLAHPLLASDAEKLSGDADELAGFKNRDRTGKTKDVEAL